MLLRITTKYPHLMLKRVALSYLAGNVGNLLVTSRNVAKFWPKCLSMPTQKLSQHWIFCRLSSDTVTHTKKLHMHKWPYRGPTYAQWALSIPTLKVILLNSPLSKMMWIQKNISAASAPLSSYCLHLSLSHLCLLPYPLVWLVVAL